MPPKATPAQTTRRLPKIGRDAVLFVLGIGGFMHELLAKPPLDRPSVLLLIAGMLGTPFIIRQVEKQ